MGNDEIAVRLDARREVVSQWRQRFFMGVWRASKSALALDAPRVFHPEIHPHQSQCLGRAHA